MTELKPENDVKILRPEELPDGPEDIEVPSLTAKTRELIRREFAKVFYEQKGNLTKLGGFIIVPFSTPLEMLLRSNNDPVRRMDEASKAADITEKQLREEVVIELCAEFGWRARFTSGTRAWGDIGGGFHHVLNIKLTPLLDG
ncbi:MAG: hypothetical protein AAB373_05185 [Patescibacteria group bacterium]